MPFDPAEIEVTTADTVKAGCVAALKASDDLRAMDLQVDYGPPLETKPPEGLYLGDIRWEETDLAELGNPNVDAREERYNIDVVIGARTDGQTQQTATERGFAILRVVNRVLLTADIFPVGWPGWLIVKPARSTEGAIDGAPAANVNAVIHVYSYLP